MPDPAANNVRSISDRARSGVDVDPQTGLFDKVIENDDLEAALEARDEARVKRLEANGAFKVADTNAKDLLVDFHLAVGEVARVGRFKIKKTAVAPRSVSFDTSGSERLSIGTIDEEG